MWKEASVTGVASRGVEEADLTLELEDGAVGERHARESACVVDKVTGAEVVRAVENEVVTGEQFEGIFGLDALRMPFKVQVRVEVVEALGGAFDFRASDGGGVMDDLPLEVVLFHAVEIAEPEGADTGGGEVEGGGAAQPPEPDDEDPCALEAGLAVDPDLGENEVPTEAREVVLGKRVWGRLHLRRNRMEEEGGVFQPGLQDGDRFGSAKPLTRNGEPAKSHIMRNRYVVIMAGGKGERFWPVSRLKRPKQLLPIVGDEPMLRQAIERLGRAIAPDHIFVITNMEQLESVREICPALPPGNIIGEPVGRDTAPAVALAGLLVKRRDPDALLAILPADHVIHDSSGFQDVLDVAFEAADEDPVLVTIGIAPTYPATGYGYIQKGAVHSEAQNLPVYAVAEFREKPDAETAKAYVESGDFFWNAGMFVWSVRTLEAALGEHAPGLSASVREMESALEAGSSIEAVMEAHYPGMEKISVDYALMEKADNVVVIESAFDWDDVGEWPAVARHSPVDGSGNSARGDAMLRDCRNTITVAHGGHTVALIGVEDLIVVTTPDATLVCRRDEAQQIKQLVKDLGDDRPHLL